MKFDTRVTAKCFSNLYISGPGELNVVSDHLTKARYVVLQTVSIHSSALQIGLGQASDQMSPLRKA